MVALECMALAPGLGEQEEVVVEGEVLAREAVVAAEARSRPEVEEVVGRSE